MLNDQLYILFMSNIFTGRARCQHIYLEKVLSWKFEVWTHLDPAASLAITIGTEQNRWAWNCSQALETNMCHMHARNYDWNDRLFPNDYEHQNMVALECLFITFYTIILIPEPSSAAFAYTMKFEVKMPNIAIDPEDHRGPKKTKSKRDRNIVTNNPFIFVIEATMYQQKKKL